MSHHADNSVLCWGAPAKGFKTNTDNIYNCEVYPVLVLVWRNDMDAKRTEFPWVLLNIAGTKYALSCEKVQSLHQSGATTIIPAAPEEIKGVVEFRGNSIPLVDVRKVLNLKARAEDIKDFEALMDARRQDHINWLNALESTVEKNSEFTLTTDPHKCAFGKWYDSYKPANSNLMFASAFARFDFPHKRIHAIADACRAFMENKEPQKAMDLIQHTRDKDLKQMLHSFETIKTAYRESARDIVVVFGDTNRKLAMAVDQIVSTERLDDFDETTIKSAFSDTEVLLGTGKRKGGEAVFLLDDEYFLRRFRGN